MSTPTGMTIRITADASGVQLGVDDARKALLGLASSLKGDLPKAANEAQKSFGGLAKSLSDWKSEQVSQGRQAKFFANEIMALIPAAEGASVAIRGLVGMAVEGMAGGLGIGLAIEGVKLLVGLWQESGKAAKKAAEESAKEWKKSVDEIKAATKGLRDEWLVLRGMDPKQMSAAEALKAKAQEIAKLREFNVKSGGQGFEELEIAKKQYAELSKAAADFMRQRGETTGEKSQQEKDKLFEKEKEDRLKKEVELMRALWQLEVDRAAQEVAREAAAAKAGLEDAKSQVNESDGQHLGSTPGMLLAHESALRLARDAKEVQAEWTKAGYGIGATVGTAFAGIVTGSLTAGQAMKMLLKSVAKAVLESVINIVKSNAISAASSAAASQAAVPIVGPALAAAAMGAMSALVLGLLDGMPGRAMGGPVELNRPYIVGERGPELFVPGQSGSISANGSFGGGINVIIHATDARSVERLFRDNKHGLVRAIREATAEGRFS